MIPEGSAFSLCDYTISGSRLPALLRPPDPVREHHFHALGQVKKNGMWARIYSTLRPFSACSPFLPRVGS